MPKKKYDDLIIKASETFRVDANIIRAVCSVESSFIPTAVRYEPNWHYFDSPSRWADRLGITREEEERCQATSFGLMQVMGAVARELGYVSHLTGLLVPEIGIFYGTKKLKKLFESKMCDNSEEKVIAAYNAGSPRMTSGGMFENQRYVDKIYLVLRALRNI